MKINWRVRIKNKAFWLAFIPAVVLVVQNIFALCGVSMDVSGLSDGLIAVVCSAFSVLALLGVVNDPTTAGLSDSNRAMKYTEPKDDKNYLE